MERLVKVLCEGIICLGEGGGGGGGVQLINLSSRDTSISERKCPFITGCLNMGKIVLCFEKVSPDYRVSSHRDVT